MEFKGCSVGGQIYRPENIGDGDTSVLIHQINRQHKTADDIRGFLTILSVCHTVIPDRSTGDLVYHASSPDERALVIGAQKHGYMFDHRTPSTVRIRVGLDEIKEEEYEILHTLEFNSDRKRMSVVVRRPDGRLMLFCKVRYFAAKWDLLFRGLLTLNFRLVPGSGCYNFRPTFTRSQRKFNRGHGTNSEAFG